MKTVIALLLALMLAAMAVPALCEAVPASQGFLGEGETLAIDLDGNGSEESVSWIMPGTGYFDSCLTLIVRPRHGAPSIYETNIIGDQAVYVLDLDGDGVVELLLTGDVMSSDYYTTCLHYNNRALYEVLFPDTGRDQNTDGYFKTGYGRIVAIENGRLTLSGSQDVLGTWFGSRKVRLTPYDRFEFNDDGIWVRDEANPDDELWDYAALTTKVDLAYTTPEGGEATLPVGEKLLIVASDKQKTARFITRDGRTGILDISPDYKGWSWRVNDVPEADCFEYLPYGD